MNILVLNGSPKGKNSITLQTVNYLEELHPNHTFEVLHVGQRIKALERDFSPALEAVDRADVLLFCYPVYTFVAPCQLHRFIELLKNSGVSLAGKYATQITTSKHFYDVTAHRYIQDNAQDMGMKYIRGLSADMEDLLSRKGQRDARNFFQHLLWSVKNDYYEYQPAAFGPAAHLPVEVPAASAAEKGGDIVIVTDCEQDNTQLQAMIDRFSAVMKRSTRIVNIREYPFTGGCLGCFHCAMDGTCIYKDNFDSFLRENIQSAEAIVYAFSIKDHSMGSVFKMYDDRQFCNGHRTVTMGRPIGYLVSGDYSKEFNLQMIIEGRAETGGNFLAGVATDEKDPNREIDRMAATLHYALEKRYDPPKNFYGVGGMKIFRDLIWLMQGLMKADHKFYKKHGQYDFPQKQAKTMLMMHMVGFMMSNPKIKAKVGNKMTEGMLMPYQKVLSEVRRIRENRL